MSDDFGEMLDALSAAGAEFLVVGAHALAGHGVVRFSGDIDLWVRPSAENARTVIEALTAFGAPLAAHGVTATDFTTPGTVYQLGVVPNRIDLLTSIDGVSFDEAWRGRVETMVVGRRVAIIGVDDLLRNKRAAGRAKDLADAEALEAMQHQRGRGGR